MQCPEISDTEGWKKYYAWKWQQIYEDKTKPEWLRKFAKISMDAELKSVGK